MKVKKRKKKPVDYPGDYFKPIFKIKEIGGECECCSRKWEDNFFEIWGCSVNDKENDGSYKFLARRKDYIEALHFVDTAKKLELIIVNGKLFQKANIDNGIPDYSVSRSWREKV